MMHLVYDISSVNNAYSFAKNFKKRFNTNCFVATEQFVKLIDNKVLYETTIGEVVFFIKKNNSFSNVYYYAASIEELSLALPQLIINMGDETLIVDIVTKDELCKEKEVFELNGFSSYTSLVRMSSMGSVDISDTHIPTSKLRNARKEDVLEIHGLLMSFFDPRAEQLPDQEDLLLWIEQDSILLYEEQGKIAGFIIYDLKTTTLYLRYWFVHPEFRDLKIGSQLFKEFLKRGQHTQRQLFWVIQTNENAIKRYLHYGFKAEKMYNFVLINKHIKYEK